ncbi:unnamed protein product [Pocillopora meandrina]|uniref:Uncharacterized protein n=1 Tax=Pocillopora meandrina TaxID=46732 RepID=A0AAU9WY77_9CNID|nr:unnamed protein product [Pocillopora meandrina]
MTPREHLSSENDVQYLSDGYDALVQSKTNMVEDLENLSLRLNVTGIDKAIDEMLFYSYQYSIKIVGVPHISENELIFRRDCIIMYQVILGLGGRNTNL